jgi:hypothetical protein
MGNRERLLRLSLGALIAALSLIWWTGTASADTIVCGPGATPPNPTTCPAFSDPRTDMAAGIGSSTFEEIRYGPYSVPANGAIHNSPINFSAPPPCTNCYVTDVIPNLVYDGDPNNATGTTANLNNGAMLHHFVLINPQNQDAVCPSGLQGQLGERWFASGNERTHMHLPKPYGYFNTNAGWVLIPHIVNKSGVAKSLSIDVMYRYRSASDTTQPTPQAARPLWLDIDGCGDSEYTILASPSYSDTHVSWTSTVSGRMIGIAGHQHDVDITGPAPCDTHCPAEGGGIAVSAELVGAPAADYFGPVPPNNPPPSDLTGATLCRSQDYYGTTWAGTQWKGHLDTMSQCGIQTDLPAGHQTEAYPAGSAYPTSGYRFNSGQVIKLHSEYQNNTGSQQTDVMGIMMAWYAPLEPGYPRPKGATPNMASLVVAYQPCSGGNRQHGGPLNALSCNPPVQSSNQLTVGTGDAWPGTTPKAVGNVRFDVVGDNGGTPAVDESNLKVRVDVTDVRRMSDLADYTGQLKENTVLRIIDRDNGPSEVGVTQDIPLGYTVPCTATTSDTTVGSTCSINTTANSVVPGTVKGGKRSIWQMAKVDLYDGGSDGVASTEPNTLFMTQGLWAP